MLGDTDYVRMRETLGILEILGYIRDLNIDNAHVFQKIGSFADFDKWHKDKEREERQLSSREWKIAIVGAIIGLIPFFVTTVIPWMVSLFSKS